MTRDEASRWIRRTLLMAGSLLLVASARADSIQMKNGIVYKSMGQPDKDGTLVYIWDGVKKVVVRDSKIERMVGDNAFRTGEKFQLVQPLVKYMPGRCRRKSSPWKPGPGTIRGGGRSATLAPNRTSRSRWSRPSSRSART